MKRAEAAKLLAVAHDELEVIPRGHREHVLNVYDELHGFEDSQLRLLDAPAARPTHDQVPEDEPDESAQERRIRLEAAPADGSQRHRILETLLTVQVGKAWLAEEVAEQTGFPLNSVSTRMSELDTGGWVSSAGPKRETSHGEQAHTYVPTQKAMQYFRAEADAALAAA